MRIRRFLCKSPFDLPLLLVKTRVGLKTAILVGRLRLRTSGHFDAVTDQSCLRALTVIENA